MIGGDYCWRGEEGSPHIFSGIYRGSNAGRGVYSYLVQQRGVYRE